MPSICSTLNAKFAVDATDGFGTRSLHAQRLNSDRLELFSQRRSRVTCPKYDFFLRNVASFDTLDKGIRHDRLAIIGRGEAVEQPRRGILRNSNYHRVRGEVEQKPAMVASHRTKIAQRINRFRC